MFELWFDMEMHLAQRRPFFSFIFNSCSSIEEGIKHAELKSDYDMTIHTEWITKNMKEVAR